MEGGIIPDNLLSDKCNACSFWNLEKKEGIAPVNRLLGRLKTIKLFRFWRAAGIVHDT